MAATSGAVKINLRLVRGHNCWLANTVYISLGWPQQRTNERTNGRTFRAIVVAKEAHFVGQSDLIELICHISGHDSLRVNRPTVVARAAGNCAGAAAHFTRTIELNSARRAKSQSVSQSSRQAVLFWS